MVVEQFSILTQSIKDGSETMLLYRQFYKEAQNLKQDSE